MTRACAVEGQAYKERYLPNKEELDTGNSAMKVLIADPQTTVRHALCIWISGLPGWEVVGEAIDSFDLIDKLNQLSPGLVILDCDLPGLPIDLLVERMRQVAIGVTIILLTNVPLESCQKDGMDVDFHVSKVDPPNRILETISKAKRRLEGKSYT
ncbi:MAG: hypothetical protein M1281_15870 [Chloroflexi bacterium]|nr:hypothetical protein [Chloroflexota bacterium]